jgi:hypothetical protein
MWESILLFVVSESVIIALWFGVYWLSLAIYNRLYGLLFRHVTKEYAEPVSFWVTMGLGFGGIGYIVLLVL